MSEIVVGPNLARRTLPAWYNEPARRWMPAREVEEQDLTLPFMARCGSIVACARTREGAVEMVERIANARHAAPAEEPARG